MEGCEELESSFIKYTNLFLGAFYSMEIPISVEGDENRPQEVPASSSPQSQESKLSGAEGEHQDQSLKELEEKERLEEGCCGRFLSWWMQDWHFHLRLTDAAILLLVIAVVFLPIGIVLIHASSKVVDISVRYDQKCPLNSVACNISIPLSDSDREILSKSKGPYFFYYRLVGFSQNQRIYVGSRSDLQLSGAKDYSIEDCDPIQRGISGKRLYPCGMVAYTYFNDDFQMYIDGNLLSGNQWSSENIAWSTDKSTKFRERPLLPDEETIVNRQGENFTMPSVGDENFMNWMRTAAFSTFRKLYRRIDSPELDFSKASSIDVSVNNRFSIENYASIKKYVVLSTVNWSGIKNPFLGIMYIVVAVLSLLSSLYLSFLAKYGHL